MRDMTTTTKSVVTDLGNGRLAYRRTLIRVTHMQVTSTAKNSARYYVGFGKNERSFTNVKAACAHIDSIKG